MGSTLLLVQEAGSLGAADICEAEGLYIMGSIALGAGSWAIGSGP